MGKYMGIDIGSSASKAVVLDQSGKIIAKSIVSKGTGTKGVGKAVAEIEAQLSVELSEMDFIVATGYGRNTFDAAHKQISELSCHELGVHTILPHVRTIIDIGGQDVKVLSIDENGGLSDFIMNEKCAAGTGRFLDVMSRVLEVPLDQMGKVHFQAKEWAQVSSTCTVFAESEVISQLSKGLPRESIVAGVHQSVASKACSLAYRIGVKNDVVMCGGVAQNAGVVDAIEKELQQSITVAPHPQITGALGAALMAYEELKKQNK